MQSQLYSEVINKLKSLKENNILEKQVLSINKLLRQNGLVQGEDYIIKSRYKTEKSIAEKLDRKSYKYLDQITDLAGIKIVFKDMSITIRAYEVFKKNLEVVKEDNYYKDSRNTGYKSIHFNLEDKDKNLIELQIKDKLNDLKQEYCHSRIYKNNLIDDNNKQKLNKYINEVIETYLSNIYKDGIIDPNIKIKEEEEKYFDDKVKDYLNMIKDKDRNNGKVSLKERIVKAREEVDRVNKDTGAKIKREAERN